MGKHVRDLPTDRFLRHCYQVQENAMAIHLGVNTLETTNVLSVSISTP